MAKAKAVPAETDDEEEGQEETGKKTVIRRSTPEEKKVYDSLAEATKGKPKDRNWYLFQVSNEADGQRFTWAPTYSQALYQTVIETDKSYSVTEVGDLPSKVEVAGYLAALSPEDRNELVKQFSKK
jgi:hypothetical protein